MTDLYYAKGLEVWKSPVRTKIEGGGSISLGFHACTASEVIGEEGAIAIAALLCLGEQAQNPPPQSNLDGVQALLHSLDRTAIAKIVDPSAWINEGGYDIEQEHSGPALIAADQIITYVLRKARALATTEGSDNG